MVGHSKIINSLIKYNNKIISGSGDMLGLLFDPREAQKASLCLLGHRGPVGKLAWSDDESIVASASRDSTVKLWDLRKGGKKYEVPPMKNIDLTNSTIELQASELNFFNREGDTDQIPFVQYTKNVKTKVRCKAITWSPIQRGVLYFGTDSEDDVKNVNVFGYHYETDKYASKTKHDSPLVDIHFLKSLKQVILVHKDKKRNMVVRNSNDWKEIGSFSAHSGIICSTALSPGQNVLVTAEGDEEGMVCFWEVDKQSSITKIDEKSEIDE